MPSEPFYSLQVMPYRDQQILADLFTPTFGKVRALLQGRTPPQPFQLYHAEAAFERDLCHLYQWSTAEALFKLSDSQLFLGGYLNELLSRLLPKQQGDPTLFGAYAATLKQISSLSPSESPPYHQGYEPYLRYFERLLFEVLGMGLDYRLDAQGHPLVPEQHYYWQPEQGWVVHAQGWTALTINALGRNDFAYPGVRPCAKHSHQRQIHLLLQGQPLHTRQWLKRL